MLLLKEKNHHIFILNEKSYFSEEVIGLLCYTTLKRVINLYNKVMQILYRWHNYKFVLNLGL